MNRRVAVLLGAVALAITGCSTHGTSSSAHREPVRDELPAALDNGALGLNSSHLPGHVAPTQACGETVHRTARSLVVRVLPDGPRAPDGSLAFTSGVCVYLPPGYATSGLRYPVIYLLHGGGGDAADAVTFGHLRQTMDARVTRRPADAAIVVMPDGDTGRWYDSMDGQIKNEQYVVSSVVPYVDRHFRTIASRRGRAVDGVSNGGLGAMLFAAKHPDLFDVAGGMSSNLDALTLPGLGAPDGAYFRANHPADLAARLDHTDVVLDISSRCTSRDPSALCFTQALDRVFLGSNRAFVAALRAQTGRRADLSYHEDDGSHQWRWWSEWLRDQHLPYLLARLADPHRAG
jgi:S-formylglutathione hydrolase FrmB